jgi:hypothetical protein
MRKGQTFGRREREERKRSTMRQRTFTVLLPLLAGCASSLQVESNPPMRPGGPNWDEVDKSVQRIKEREKNQPRLVETVRTQEQGFHQMSDDDYASVLDGARSDVRKAFPKMADGEVEKEATKQADEAKRQYEHAISSSASSSYEWKKP